MIWSAWTVPSMNVHPSLARPSKSTNASWVSTSHVGAFGEHPPPGPAARAVLEPRQSVRTATSTATTKMTTGRDDLTGDAETQNIDRPLPLERRAAGTCVQDFLNVPPA